MRKTRITQLTEEQLLRRRINQLERGRGGSRRGGD